MRHIRLARADDADGWRDAARALIAASVPPERVSWSVGEEGGDLFAALAPAGEASAPEPGPGFTVPRAFLEVMRLAIVHRDPERFGLLYTLLWRLRTAPRLIEDRADPLVRRLDEMVRSVRRDMHKMRAFVRFREVAEGEGSRFVAWFEPDHHIVRLNAGFFVRRFAAMRWSILTPECAIHWDGERLTEGPGASPADAPGGDPVEAMWHGYYAAIFNPARVKIGAMLKEMPRKYWKNLPETALIPQLIAGAQARETQMIAAATPADDATAPRRAVRGDSGDRGRAWALLRAEAAGCTRCPLHAGAGGTVFGEGPVDARLMLVGEQPGDREDQAGRPFVGPAGQLLDRALGEAGIDRGRLYLTNAVKHFKHVQRGPRRIHQTPGPAEIDACAWWIEQERLVIRPPVLLALGATAARALLGPGGTIAALRGRAHRLADGAEAWVTVHPSYLLRLPDADRARDEYRRFVDDLGLAWARAEALAGGGAGALEARP
ncbi:UdgX family uracil-DNA binding protein [Sphingomonas changnyeongensis]|uniref:Type-4 uracil-DNA glycosylase n=1 Tax=Sphingomonas changnyeongensis TaxID=2698679 RepID=A0A7Z2S9A8_9SPHN|nr:UdgX family uracil-DNA binding protein [Sphingomonas changnyeongensis]QHL90584.1 UdgX family uracil-DNA binding protein [Sphingomonas changnyeongensis]